MTTFKKGDIVLYSPIMMPGEPKFGAVVRETPWQLCHGAWVTHLIGLSREYGEHVHVPGKETVHAACFEAMELAPILYRKHHGWSTNTWNWKPGTWSDGLIQRVSGKWVATANDHHHQCESYESARAAVEELCK